jgi:hypothetical protein
MKPDKRHALPLLFPLLLFVNAAFCQNESVSLDGSAQINIHFLAFVSQRPLKFGQAYTSDAGEIFSVDKFRFYISHAGMSPDGWELRSSVLYNDKSYLIDFSDSNLCGLTLYIGPGNYHSLSFLLGIDSIQNTNGAHDGPLDPMNGMYWTWNSGYVNFKLEGNSPVSPLPQHAINYHIGGYRAPYNTSRSITILLSKSGISIKKQDKVDIWIETDIHSFFSGTYPFSVHSIPACDVPGKLASHMADNYARMFRALNVSIGPR